MNPFRGMDRRTAILISLMLPEWRALEPGSVIIRYRTSPPQLREIPSTNGHAVKAVAPRLTPVVPRKTK